ncbi:MAG: hypothetical protein KC621_01460 [Myxococcales bacterium]|nr:hypothetical protein [Myxococcales bacterium]
MSTWAMWQVGYVGIWQVALNGPGELQVFTDLFVACGIASGWLIGDARKRGISPWPWVAAVLPLGSIPILTYVVLRPWLGTAPERLESA